ncbi:MAG: hypothetical protein ACHQDE_00875 [Acidimicrobiia bacterium]
MTKPEDHDPRDPQLRETGAALRAVWRAAEEEWTRAAFEAWEHERTLVDVARDCMHRGDTVTVQLPGRRLIGPVVSVGDDFVRIGTATGPVDVRVSCDARFHLRVVAPARAGGSRGLPGVATFRARLLQFEADRAAVEIGVHGTSDVMVGSITVGRDQVSLEDGNDGRVYVPIGSLSWVRPVDVD